MRVLLRRLATVAALGGAVVSLSLVEQRPAAAADHLDAPARTDPAFDSTPDRPADIADIYAWHTSTTSSSR